MQKKQKNSIHIKKGDTVKILTGKDKGKSGKIVSVLVKENKVIVEGLNSLPKVTCLKPRGAFYVFPNINLLFY